MMSLKKIDIEHLIRYHEKLRMCTAEDPVSLIAIPRVSANELVHLCMEQACVTVSGGVTGGGGGLGVGTPSCGGKF